jgi:hypothetical protein
MSVEGIPGLRFYDAKGKNRMEMVLFEDRVPVLAMFDRNGENKAVLLLREGDYPVLHLGARGTAFKVDLSGEEGITVVVFENEGIGSVTLGLDGNMGAAGLTLQDVQGIARADLWTDPEGGPNLRLQDAKGVVRVTIDESGLEIVDQRGNHVWSAAAKDQGLPLDQIGAGQQEKETGNEGTVDFDQYFKKPVFIPLFIWDDGEMRPFEGYCRGNGPISDQEDWEATIGVFTAEGKYFSVLIDTKIRCALPQFFIDEKPFHFPIVSFGTMGPWVVDPETGILQLPPNLQQGAAGLQNPPSIEHGSGEERKEGS